MSAGHPDLLVATASLAARAASVEPAAAQTPMPPETPQAESTSPQDPRSTGSVGRSNGPLSDS
jgi:hypothetical protein